MKNTVVLEMLLENRVEELKTLLADEIYKDSLSGCSNAKKRYAAMKKFFKYVDNKNAICQYPCKGVEINGDTYNAFTDGYCFVLTKESIGEMEAYDEAEHGRYIRMDAIVRRDDYPSVETVDVGSVVARAKSDGYKYKKSELGGDFKYIFTYKNTSYKISLLDKAFSIIDDGEAAKVYYRNGVSPLLVETSIGIAGIMPFRNTNDSKFEKVCMDEAVV